MRLQGDHADVPRRIPAEARGAARGRRLANRERRDEHGTRHVARVPNGRPRDRHGANGARQQAGLRELPARARRQRHQVPLHHDSEGRQSPHRKLVERARRPRKGQVASLAGFQTPDSAVSHVYLRSGALREARGITRSSSATWIATATTARTCSTPQRSGKTGNRKRLTGSAARRSDA